MPRFTIEGIDSRVDGSYDLDRDDANFTYRELDHIKRVSGVRAGEITEALSAADSTLILAVAHVLMTRAGKDAPIDMLLDAQAGAIRLEYTPAELAEQQEDDDLPPANAPTGANVNESEPTTSPTGTANGSVETLEESQLDIGGRTLPIGSESSPVT